MSRRSGMTFLCHALTTDPDVLTTLAMVRWLAAGSERPDVVASWGGPLEDSFRAVADVHVVNGVEGAEVAPQPLDPLGLDLAERNVAPRRDAELARRVPLLLRDLHLPRAAEASRAAFLRRRLSRRGGPIWVAGPDAARLCHYVPSARTVVAHLGELSAGPAQVVEDPADLAVLRARPDGWVAGSERSAEALRAFGATTPIELVPDALLPEVPAEDRCQTREELEVALGLERSAPLVASLGAIDWWDNPDLFVQVAWNVHQRAAGAPVRFLWVGAGSSDRMLWPLRHDIAHAGLDAVVFVAPDDVAATRALAAADLLVLSGCGPRSGAHLRDLERLAVGLVRWPVDGENPGRSDGEIVVRHLDDRAMADAVLELLDEDAAAAERRARTIREHHRIDTIVPRVVAFADRLAGSRT